MTLLNAKQSQYWCFEICNVIEFWILWNYSYWCEFQTNGYNYINLDMRKNNTKYRIDQTCIISCEISHIDPSTAHINILNTLNESSMIGMKYVFLIMIVWKLSMIVRNMFKPFFVSSYTTFSFNIGKNCFLYIVMDEKLLINAILLILMIILIVDQFYVMLRNHYSPTTDCDKRTKYMIQQTNIFKIILCINIIFIYQHNGNIFSKVSCMCIIWVIIIAIRSMYCYQLDANTNNSCTLNQNRRTRYQLNKNTTTTLTIISYGKFVADMYEMCEFYGIVNKIHNFDIFLSIVNVFDTIVHEIEVLVAIYVIIGKMWLFIITHGTYVLIFTFDTHSNIADSFLFFLIRNNTDNWNLIMCIINIIIALKVQTDCIFCIVIIIAMAKPNVIRKRDINWKFNKSRIIWFILNRNKTFAIIVAHYDEFNTSLCKMNYYDVMTTVMNKVDIIINTVDTLVVMFVIIGKFLLFAIEIIASILQILILKVDYTIHMTDVAIDNTADVIVVRIIVIDASNAICNTTYLFTKTKARFHATNL